MEPSGNIPAVDKKRKRSAPEKPIGTTRPTPSEEEVEEFFTLLRRIHSTVNRAGKDNGKVKPLPLVDGGSSDAKMERVEEGADIGVMIFDLNAVPDETEEGNAC